MDSFEATFQNLREVREVIPGIYLNEEWFTKAPKFSTVRVNTLNITPEEVAELITDYLVKECLLRGRNLEDVPSVEIHPDIPDTVVVGSWPVENALLPLQGCPHAIVDVNCGNAVLRGAQVFAPGLLAIPHGVCEGSLVNVFADMEGKCLRGYAQPTFPGPTYFVGRGTLLMDRHKLFDNDSHPKGVAIKMLEVVSGVPSFPVPPVVGLLQNLPSILCGHLLMLENVNRVLDMCAAPGNKTSHISTIMKNKGEVYALDRNKNKIDKITSLCSMLGVVNVQSFPFDSTKAWSNCDKVFQGSPPFPSESFERILLDAPCSALGQRPMLKSKATLKGIKSFPPLQRKLFHNAVNLLKGGGILVYSTCTVTLEENEGLVSWALSTYPQITLAEPRILIGSPGLHVEGLTQQDLLRVQRFAPSHLNGPNHDTIGFFIAVFQKKLSQS